MGQPSSTQVYQQPTQAELDANKLSNQQKTAALAKIHQAVRGESEGLRGMGGLYEWAGPTPWLAGDPRATKPGGGKPAPDPNKTGPYGVPENTPGGAAAWTTGKGFAPTPPGTVPGYISGAGPAGDRSPGSIGPMVYSSGAGPKGDRTTPGWTPAPSIGGPRGDRGPQPATASPFQRQVLTSLYQAAGQPVPAAKAAPNVPPTRQQYAQKVAAQTGLVPGAKPTAVPPPPASPATYAQQVAVKTGLIKAPATQPTVAQTQPAPAAVTPATPAVSAKPTAGAILSPAPPAAKTQPAATALKPLITQIKPSIYAQVGRGSGRL